MNPIEEMMKKYGVVQKPDICWRCLHIKKCENKECEVTIETNAQMEYPPFTPEKQLEIIKLISQRTTFGLEIEEKHKHTIFTINTNFGSIGSFTFEKALAEFLTNIFYYCSNEAQKQQIKEILENEG